MSLFSLCKLYCRRAASFPSSSPSLPPPPPPPIRLSQILTLLGDYLCELHPHLTALTTASEPELRPRGGALGRMGPRSKLKMKFKKNAPRQGTSLSLPLPSPPRPRIRSGLARAGPASFPALSACRGRPTIIPDVCTSFFPERARGERAPSRLWSLDSVGVGAWSPTTRRRPVVAWPWWTSGASNKQDLVRNSDGWYF